MNAVLTRNILGKNADAKYALARGCEIAETETVILRNAHQTIPHDTDLAPPIIDLMASEGCRRVYTGEFVAFACAAKVTKGAQIVFDAFKQQFVFAATMQPVGDHRTNYLVATPEGIWLCDNIAA
jgi:hypothetical protein